MSELKTSPSASIGHNGAPYVHEELDGNDSMQDGTGNVLGNSAAAVLSRS